MYIYIAGTNYNFITKYNSVLCGTHKTMFWERIVKNGNIEYLSFWIASEHARIHTLPNCSFVNIFNVYFNIISTVTDWLVDHSILHATIIKTLAIVHVHFKIVPASYLFRSRTLHRTLGIASLTKSLVITSTAHSPWELLEMHWSQVMRSPQCLPP